MKLYQNNVQNAYVSQFLSSIQIQIYHPWFEALATHQWTFLSSFHTRTMERGRRCPLTSLKSRTSDRVLVLGDGFLGKLDRVLDLVKGFLGELKLELELVEGFLEELKYSKSSSSFVSSFNSLAFTFSKIVNWMGNC